MTKTEKVFNVIVMFVVMLTGGLFGAYTGYIYQGFTWLGMSFDETYVWTGMAAGLVSAFPIAKWYFQKMSKTITENGSKLKAWSIGTFLASWCGIICTVVVHGVMVVFSFIKGGGDLGLGLYILPVGLIVGAVAGVAVGALCSLACVYAIKGRQSETA